MLSVVLVCRGIVWINEANMIYYSYTAWLFCSQLFISSAVIILVSKGNVLTIGSKVNTERSGTENQGVKIPIINFVFTFLNTYCAMQHAEVVIGFIGIKRKIIFNTNLGKSFKFFLLLFFFFFFFSKKNCYRNSVLFWDFFSYRFFFIFIIFIFIFFI